jgi:ABC-2 type transport system permease protein
MLLKVAGFELRYQLRNPIFWIAVILFAALVFAATSSFDRRRPARP